MNISDIYVHDAQLHRIIEDVKADTLIMEVDLPILERDEKQEPRLLVFDDAYNYKVFEQPWCGLVTILEMHVVGEHEGRYQVRIETNAGYRELFCTGVSVLEHNQVADRNTSHEPSLLCSSRDDLTPKALGLIPTPGPDRVR